MLKNSFCELSQSSHCDELAHIHQYSFETLDSEGVQLSVIDDVHESECHEGKVGATVFNIFSSNDAPLDFVDSSSFKLSFYSQDFFLELFYRKHGYDKVSVRYTIESGTRLRLDITEGPLVTLGLVNFVGNKSEPAEVLVEDRTQDPRQVRRLDGVAPGQRRQRDRPPRDPFVHGRSLPRRGRSAQTDRTARSDGPRKIAYPQSSRGQ